MINNDEIDFMGLDVLFIKHKTDLKSDWIMSAEKET
jgi:hypothetical protein